jgi:hypothetical protein
VFITISAFYPHFSVLSPFQRFIPISVSAFSFRFRDSVSAFYPYTAVATIIDRLKFVAVEVATIKNCNNCQNQQ